MENIIKSDNQSSIISRKNYNGIDLLKLAMAIIVVAIHTHPFENIKSHAFIEVYESVTDLAVPFFFLAAGFLLARKLSYPYNSQKDIVVITQYLKKTFRLYAIWTAVYFPLAVYGFVESKTPVVKALFYYLRGILFVGESNYSYVLWYLLSTIFALILIIVLLKRKISPKMIMLFGFVICFISWGVSALSSYEGDLPTAFSAIQKVIHYTIINGRILSGAVYLPIGMFLSYKRIPKIVNVLLFIGGFVANCVITNSLISQYLLIASATGLFGLAEGLELKNSQCYGFMRKMSTVIYFIHMYIFFVWKTICTMLNKDYYGMDGFFAVCITSIIISFLYVHFSRNKRPVKQIS